VPNVSLGSLGGGSSLGGAGTPAAFGGGNTVPKKEPVTKEEKLIDVFEKIQESMRTFEMQIAPRFANLTEQQQRAASDMKEQALLSGSITQTLHERFTSLQQQAMQGEQMTDVEFDGLLVDLRAVQVDIRDHVKDMQILMDKVYGTSGGSGGIGVQKSEPIQVSSPGTGSQHLRGDASQNRNNMANNPQVDLGSMGSSVKGPNLDTPSLGPMPGTPGGFGGAAGNRMGTPGGFGGAGAAAAGGRANDTPEQKEMDKLLTSISTKMKEWEKEIGPQVNKMASARHVMRDQMTPEDYSFMNGTQTERLNSKWKVLTQKLQRSDIPAQMVPVILQEIRDFEKQITEHNATALDVLPRAKNVYEASDDSYKKTTKNLSSAEIKNELENIEQELRENITRLPKMISSMKTRMKAELPKLADPAVIQREADKLGHMMSTLASSAEVHVGRCREGLANGATEKDLNDIFFDDLLQDYQRFAATVQDLDKEELKANTSGDPAAGLARKVGKNDVELGSVLGTRGVKKTNLKKGGNLVEKAVDSTAPASAAAAEKAAQENAYNRATNQRTGLSSLPKLSLDEL